MHTDNKILLQNLKTSLLDAVSRLDLKGENQIVTEALCIIHCNIDAALIESPIEPDEVYRLGLEMAQLSKHG